MTAAELVFLLRPYRPSDLERLGQIDRSCFPPRIAFGKREMRQALEGKGALATVAATDSGEIAGFVAAERTSPRKGHIVTINVRPQFRREGLGMQLMRSMEAQLLRLGASKIELETGEENIAAQSLFQGLGYECLRIVDDYYPDGSGAWIMQKRITRRSANSSRAPAR